MPVLLSEIRVPISADVSDLPSLIEKQFSLPKQSVQAVRLVRRSLDARKKQDIHFSISAVLQAEPSIEDRLLAMGKPNVKPYTQKVRYELPCLGTQTPKGRIAVVGFGPAGLFAAYYLAQAGYRPVVIERGAAIETRKAHVNEFWRSGNLRPNSNVMFGEGGAGAFSDGKLTTRSKDERIDAVLETFVKHGAPAEITYDFKPHIGTDLLCSVVRSMREEILRMGGEVCFDTRLADIGIENGSLRTIAVQRGESIERMECAACILTTGQAADDIYGMLIEKGLPLSPKPFALGVRIEHPQSMIDNAQYGPFGGDPRLGAAEYRLTAKSKNRGVYTFCMCPGGQVIASSSGEGQVVTNGMSLHARDGENANAAVIVQVTPEDYGTGALDGLLFQRKLEHQAYLAGGKSYFAPAQRVEDFMAGRKTRSFAGNSVSPTYLPGVAPCSLDTLLPAFIAEGLRSGIAAFDKQIKGFLMPDAVLTAVESRSSSPVRILRDEWGEALCAKGLYPAGEGAGYAGGIVSAAIDGLRAAEWIANRYLCR